MDMGQHCAAGTAPIFSVESIDKYYGGLRALNSVSLDILQGEILALVGDNGAGKSTLIKVLSGAVQPDGGEIRKGAQTVELRSPRAATELGIETVHQNLGLVDTLDVPKNVFLGREIKTRLFGLVPQLDHAEMRERTRTLLKRFGIGMPKLNDPVSKLSGGQRQTIAVSRLLLAEPSLLIMDEPMAALGVDEGRKMLDLVVKLRDEGLTIVIISHNLEHVFQIADRIAVMKNGKLVATLPTAETTREAIVGLITLGASGVREEDKKWLS